jgi:penicillin-binding protein 2
LVILARLWYLQIAHGPELLAMSETQRTRLIRRVAARGTILDSSGRVLATSRAHFVISVLPDEVTKHPDVIPRLAAILQISQDDLVAKIKLNRPTPFDPVPISDDVSMDLLTKVEEQAPDLPGVLVVKDPKRDYQDEKICAHILGIARPISADRLEKLRSKGYRGGDIIGIDGLEATYESDLRGIDGGQRIEVNASGRIRHTLEEVKPQPGHTLKLTIDRDLQQAAYEALQDPLAMGHPGAVVAMDPNDGAVLAMVSVPSYDLNRYGKDFKQIASSPGSPLINRASGSAYPIGSTFKLVTAAAGLETGVLSPDSSDICNGQLRVGDRVFHCDKRSGHGRIYLPDAIGQSCDVFFWHVAQQLGDARLAEWARRFGLGSRTGIDLPPSSDRRGIVPTPDWKRKRFHQTWYPGDLINMAIGQGFVAASPLQVADYTAAIANGGTLYRPQLVRQILDSSVSPPRVLHELEPEVRGTLDLKQSTRDVILEGMRRAMLRHGTAETSHIPGLDVAGKTGSAQIIIHGQAGTNSVFTCFAPADHPRIVITVLVEDGGNGADTAAPIAQRLLAKYFKMDVALARIGGTTSGVD